MTTSMIGQNILNSDDEDFLDDVNPDVFAVERRIQELEDFNRRGEILKKELSAAIDKAKAQNMSKALRGNTDQ
jgi:hypothetical protein